MPDPSVTGRVTSELRRAIISGAFPGGARLTETHLAKEYGVSRMPVREALRALAAEGFVDLRPYAGARVAVAALDEAADLFAVRSTLEDATVRRAAERARRQAGAGVPDEQWWRIRAELTAVLAEGDAVLAAGDLGPLPELNQRFHNLLAQLSGSATLEEIVRLVSDKIEWMFSATRTYRGSSSWAAHKEILAAIDAGRPEEARRQMADHLQRSSTSLAPDAAPTAGDEGASTD